jgi:hypothetical protein
MIWNYIKAANFFHEYCPEIKDWKKKMTGRNGRGNPIDFTKEEKRSINKALKKLKF